MDTIGFGTWPFTDDEAVDAVASAIDVGYRLIDTAAKYENEAAVGRGILASGIAREEIRIQTKLRGAEHGDARGALERSLERLGVDYVDSYLIHWPLPMLGQYVDAWAAMVAAQQDGLVRQIGVSNFEIEHLDRIENATGVRPWANQIKCDPEHARVELRDELAARGISVQAWSPLGRTGELLELPEIVRIAERRGWAPAQVVLAWQATVGNVPIVRSGNPDRQRANLEATRQRLGADELDALARIPQLDLGWRDSRTYDER